MDLSGNSIKGEKRMTMKKTGFYTFARGLICCVYKVIFRAKARGADNFPKDENFIIYGNHFSAWDPLTIAYAYKAGEIHFMAKDSLFRVPVVRAVLTRLHAFPVNRGSADMAAMRTAMQVLRDGHVLGIFPEGTRQQGGPVSGIETGVAVLALKSDVPLVPVLIGGKYTFWGSVRAVAGEPVRFDDLRGQRVDTETLDEVNRRLVNALEALRPLLDF